MHGSISRAALAALALWVPASSAGVLYESDFSAYEGAGLAPGAVGGTLDSNRWTVIGLSDGDSAPGATLLSGDHARGLSAGGVGTGGLYGFLIPGTAGGRAPGVQATGSDMTPGALLLTLDNTLGAALHAITVSFDLLVRNDGARSTRLSVDLGVGGLWEPLLGFVTPPAASTDGWLGAGLSGSAENLALEPGAPLALRWRLEDAGGSGGRDEVAFDRIRVLGVAAGPVAVPEAQTAQLLAAGLVLLALGSGWRRFRALRIVNAGASGG